MTRKNIIAGITSLLVLVGLAVWSLNPASAFPVFDASNYSQNLLTAARALTQINNQIQALQNQTSMLQNMALNLQRMDYSSVQQMTSALQQVDVLMGQAQGITFNINDTNASFRQLYPQQYDAAITSNQLVTDARSRWQTSMDAYRQTMTVQSQVVGNVQSDRGLLATLVTQSQGSVGALQAQQATNQLLALSIKQQLQIQNMMAAQYRAEAIERSRRAESEEEARAANQRFMGSRNAYAPQ